MTLSTAYILPILAFLFVFLITYALLAKTKILGANNFVHLMLSFVVAIIFVLSPSATQFTVATIPWLVVLLAVLLFILLVLFFVQGKIENIIKNPTVTIILVGVILLVFVAAAINVFGPFFASYTEQGLFGFLFSPAIIAGIALLAIAAIISWVLTRE